MNSQNKKPIAAAILAMALAANVFAQDEIIAYIPIRVNVAATLTLVLPDGAPQGARVVTPESGSVTVAANTPTTVALALGGSGNTTLRHGSRMLADARASMRVVRGGVSLDLSPRHYRDATISVYSVNGKRVLSCRASAASGAQSVSRSNIAAGVYLLSVKGENANTFTSRLTHTGGKMDINVTYGNVGALRRAPLNDEPAALAQAAVVSNGWKIIAVPTGSGYLPSELTLDPVAGQNPEVAITLSPFGGGGGAVTQKDWTPTAASFAIVEKSSASVTNADVQNLDAANAVVSWNLRPTAVKYEVYRDGSLAGTVVGNIFEDYGLTIGRTYEYVVAGYTSSNSVTLSMPVRVSPFTATADPGTWRYMNRNASGGSEEATVSAATGTGDPGGVLGADGRRYEFRVIGDNNARTFEYRRTSSNGAWGSWTSLPSSPGGNNALTVGAWRGDLNGTPTTINPSAFVSSGVNWNGSGDQAGVKLEGVHWYRVHDKGLVIDGTREGKYVLGCHREPSGNYNLAHIMLVSFYPNNGQPYGEVTYSGRPFGFESRDQRIFVDNDGTAYAMCSALGDSHFFKLDPEWKEPIEHTNHVFKGQYKETPDILRYGDWYFYFGSRQNGWYPSQVQYAMSRDIGGVWSGLKDFGNVVTFGAQFNGIRTDMYGDGKTAYGFYSYRWSNQWDGISKENNGNPRRFSILNIHGDYVSSHWFNNIVYYPTHGYVGVRPGRNLSLGKKVTAPSGQKTANLQAVTDGMETADAPRYENNATPYQLTIDLETQSVIREITVTTRIVGGSESPCQYTISGSADGNSYTMLADASSNGQPGFVVHNITDTKTYRYVRLSVSKFNDVRHNNANTVSWADGVYEVAVYGTR